MGNAIVEFALMPTRTTRPPGRTAAIPDDIADSAPDASMKESTPIVVSSSSGVSTSVAPNPAATASRVRFTSVTTMRVAPAARATWTQSRPTGPAPVINTPSPTPTSALRQAAIATDSGSNNAAASSLTESGTGWANADPMVTNSASAPSTGGVA